MNTNDRSLSPEVYYNHVAATYDAIFSDPISRAEDLLLQNILERMLSPGVKILDCGCGTGLGRTITSAITDDYLGIDISEEMIERARQNHGHEGMFRTADMTRLGFLDDQSFDCVISLNGAFSHVADAEDAAAEMMRVLKPGGLLLVMVYSRYALSRLRRFVRNGFCPAEGPYAIRHTAADRTSWAKFYTPGELKRLFGGLQEAEVTPLNIIPDNFCRGGEVRKFTAVLMLESRLPRFVHGLAHALILTGAKCSGTAASAP